MNLICVNAGGREGEERRGEKREGEEKARKQEEGCRSGGTGGVQRTEERKRREKEGTEEGKRGEVGGLRRRSVGGAGVFAQSQRLQLKHETSSLSD